MRLIDHLRDGNYLAQSKDARNFRRYLKRINNPNLPIVDVTNVSEYMVANGDRLHGLEMKDVFSCALPPFSTCWMEFMGITGGWTGEDEWKRIGTLICSFDMRSRSLENKIRQLDRIEFPKDSRPNLDQVAWIIQGQMSIFFEAENITKALCFMGSTYLLLDEQGILQAPVLGRHRIQLESLTQNESDRWSGGMINAMCVFAMASSFMSCRNVQLTENQAPRHERRQRERENKPALTKYYTLNIEPMKKTLRTEGKSEEVGLKKALHICRGHFAHYTPDKPLFGKVSGRFWIPAHVRGSKEVGEIKKDYRVLPPKEKTEQ